MSTTSTAADLAAHLAVRHPEIGGDDLAAIAADAVTMTAPRAYASLAGRLAPVPRARSDIAGGHRFRRSLTMKPCTLMRLVRIAWKVFTP